MTKKVIFIAINLCFIALIFLALFYTEQVFSLLHLDKLGFEAEKYQVSFSQLWEIMRQLDPVRATFWLCLAVVMKLLGITSAIYRWKLLLRGQGLRIPFWYLAKCFFVGRAIGYFLPATVGLDGYRLVESSAYTREVIKCTTVIAVEKLIGFMALALLVFLTLPLGMRLMDFNPIMLGAVLLALIVFISTAFLLLLNPRVVQVLVAVVPTPAAIRDKMDKLGAAVTAYSEHRAMLMAAVALGVCVHLGVVLMYFCTAMAVLGDTSVLLDSLFASTLVIVGGIIIPTVMRVGVREGVYTYVLGAKWGTGQAFFSAHLGLWAGEVIPFILSMPVLLLAGRPDRDKFMAELEETRREAAAKGRVEAVNLAPEVVRDYRAKLIDTILAGLFGGLIGGALIGLGEAAWRIQHLASYSEVSAYWWAPLVYGIVFTSLGLGVAAGLIFLYLLFNRFAAPAVSFGLCVGAVVTIAGAIIGRFCFQRDVLGEHALSLSQNIGVLGGALAAGLAAGIAAAIAASVLKGGRGRAIFSGLTVYAVIVLIGGACAAMFQPKVEAKAFTPPATAAGPNIILIAADALRADYLKVYNPDAAAAIPSITALTKDAINFKKCIAQSSWTKPSFATIFSGMYPEAHTAYNKSSALPDSVTTFAEVLEAGGYYTKGFSNNPNNTGMLNFDQGFVDYVDLQPNLYFGAQPSSERLVVYDILRKVVQKIYQRLGNRIVITDFYQPANVVTQNGLNWIDSATRPKDTPIFLFLHYMDTHDPFLDPLRPGHGYARAQLGNPDPKDTELRDAFVRSYNYGIETLDHNLGILLEGLRERGLYDNSLIIFTADHGEEFLDHGGWWHGLSLYDEVISVPLLVKLPGDKLAGTDNTDLARHVDIAPTIAQFAGLRADQQWQGSSLFTDSLAFANADTSQVYSHLDFEGIVEHSVRTQSMKLIHSNDGNKRNYPPTELYNLESDPGEHDNLAASPDQQATIKQYDDVMQQMRDFVIKNQAEPSMSIMSPEAIQQLESLGYVGQ